MRFFTTLLIPLFFSCSLMDKDNSEETVARVQDKILYISDIDGVVPPGSASNDSILIIDNYIKSWVMDNLILTKAEINLDENQKNVTKQLEDYRRSLIMYAYEKELIKQRLDTSVSNEEVENFYDNNKKSFELRDNIVKVRYLKINKKAPQLTQVRKVYKSNKEEDLKKFKSYSFQYGDKFHLNENEWILFDALKKEVPIRVTDAKGYLKNIKNIEMEDSISYYFVHIKDYRLKEDVSPMSFETKNIKSIIINKRKLSLINKIRNDLYNEAFLNKDIEIYENKN